MKDTNETTNGSRKSTRQLLVKIPNYTGLYRHSLNDTYYGIKKIAGKRKEHSLDTTDRKIAETRFKDWVDSLGKIDHEAEKLTLAELVDKFTKTRAGRSQSTRDTEASIIKRFKGDWDYGFAMRVSKVKPSMLDEWLAKQEPRLRHSSYNRYAQFLKDLFLIAKNDKVILESPYVAIQKPWKRPQKVKRQIPTDDQFKAIVANIRMQKFNAENEDSADFVEFLGLAAVGQAEARTLKVGDIDWNESKMWFVRRKTQNTFHVPVYPHLKLVLKRMVEKLGLDATAETRVFKINDAKKALAAACERLNFPAFSQRSLRQYGIGKLWKAGVDKKLIAEWQGHIDGGELIMNTYTEVFGGDDKDYVASQLAKLKE